MGHGASQMPSENQRAPVAAGSMVRPLPSELHLFSLLG